MSKGVSIKEFVSIIQDCLENPSPNGFQFDKAVQFVYSFLPHTPCEQNAIDTTDGYQAIGGQHNSGNDITKESQQPQPKGWFGQLLDLMCNPELYAKGFHWLAPNVTFCCVIVPVFVNTIICFKHIELATEKDKERMNALTDGPMFKMQDFFRETLTSTLPGAQKIVEWVLDVLVYYVLCVLVSLIAPTVLPLLGVPTWLSALLSGTGQGVSSCFTSFLSLLGKIPWRGIVKNTCFGLYASAIVFVLLIIGIVTWEAVLYCCTNAWSYIYHILYYVVTTTFVALCVIHCTIVKLHAFFFEWHFVAELHANREELEGVEVQIEKTETSLSQAATEEERWIDMLCTVAIIAVQCMHFTEGYVLQRYLFGLLARLVWLALESSSGIEQLRHDAMEWLEFGMCKKYAADALKQEDLQLAKVLQEAYPDCNITAVSECIMSCSVFWPKYNKWDDKNSSVTFDTHRMNDLLPYRCLKSKYENHALTNLIEAMSEVCESPLWATRPVIQKLVKACNTDSKAFRAEVLKLKNELQKAVVQNGNDSLTTPLEESKKTSKSKQLKVTPCDHLLMKHCFTIVVTIIGLLLCVFLWFYTPTLTTVGYRMVEDKNGIHPIPEFFNPDMCGNFINSTYKATLYECEDKEVEGDASKEHVNTTQPPEMPKNVSLVEIFRVNDLCLGKHWNTAKGKVDVTYSSQYQEAKCHVRDAFETLAHLLREWAFPIRNLKKLTAEYLLKQVEKFQSTVQALGKEAINVINETVKQLKNVKILLLSFDVESVSFYDLPLDVRFAICLLARIICWVLSDIVHGFV